MASKHLEQLECPEQLQDKQHGGDDHRPFDEDVVAPVFRERRLGLVHHAISHVVTGLPSASLPSLSTTPMAVSSSRMRSDSLKSLRARAAARSAIRLSMRTGSMPLASCLRSFHSAALCERKPSMRSVAAKSARASSFALAS